VATLLLTWFGYRATSEWQRSTKMVLEQRTDEVATLMITALSRDMRGVQGQLLPQLDPVGPDAEPFELGDDIANIFARFPYPESFFSWTAAQAGPGTVYVFNRADRQPQWHHGSADAIQFPTTILKDPPEMAGVLNILRKEATLRARFVLFETTIGNGTYQVVARPVYGGPSNTSLVSIVGFTVSIDWAREHYFSELTNQLSRIVDGNNSMVLQILDENGRTVASSRAIPSSPQVLPIAVREESFPVLFFDPVLRATASDAILPVRYWKARVQAVEDQSVTAAASGSSRTFMLISFAAVAAVIGLLLTVRAARAAALLATMKSEFVSTVTHELKTPLAGIRLVSETLARGRFESAETVSEYAGLLLGDVTRLTRTVDNLLTFSRIEDVKRFYSFESLDPGTLLEDALDRFHPQLKELNFDVVIDIPVPLPMVYADRTAILQVLDNLLDNAIRYSNGNRHLGVSASSDAKRVSMKIEDKGHGIPSEEITRVFEKFFRGRDATAAGSGLGLAIADRVIRDHHGEIRLFSTPGVGTVAEIVLPVGSATQNRNKN
jgi:signal transduction histidine kinase